MPGPIEPMTKRGRPSAAWPDATSRASCGGVPVELEGLVGEAVLVEHERERAERRGLDAVDAGLEELVVHLGDEVGPGRDEVLVAALERFAAEVVGAEVVALHPRAERAVEHEHALVERVEERVHGAAADGRRGSSGVCIPPGYVAPRRTSTRFGASLYTDRRSTVGVVGCRLGMKVYTRNGDDGTTGLLYGGRVGKDEVGPEAYGAVDEAVERAGPGPGRDRARIPSSTSCSSSCSASCSWSAPSSPPRPTTAAKLKPGSLARHGRDGDAGSSRSSTT